MQIAPLLNQTLPVHGSLSWKGVNYRYNIFNLQSTLGVNWIVAQLIEDTPTDLYIRRSSTWVYIDQDLFYKIRISVKLSLKYLLKTWLCITHENMDENNTRNINMNSISIIVIVVIFAFAMVLLVVVSYYITRPLSQLSTELEKVAKLELDLDMLPSPRIEEGRKLHQAFVVMHAAFSSFRRFVPSTVILSIMRANVSWNFIQTSMNFPWKDVMMCRRKKWGQSWSIALLRWCFKIS